MFSGVVNPYTGKLEWVQRDSDVTSETADISNELARSQYGDMLLDKQRNHLYQRGLEAAIAEVRALGREAHVLDIGTGTGLLSMMAARAGAMQVTACEVKERHLVLRPMVRIARQVISQNGLSDVIRVVPKRSTEMTEADMPCRANILVTEVFDTELIGEGALVTFTHAHKHLLEPNAIVVPSLSRMYVRLIRSDFLWQSHKIMPQRLPEGVQLPVSWGVCPGPPSVWDLHVEEVKVPEQMRLLSESVEIASFQFSDPELHSDVSFPPAEVLVTEGGVCHGLVMWWDMKLGDHTLSMTPWDYRHWRDHWLQAVQLWPHPITLEKGEAVRVGLQHDDYSVWFSMKGRSAESAVSSIERPLCTCGVHTACSRSRISVYNDTERTALYVKVLSKVLLGKSTVVCIGDGCLLPLFLLLQQRGDHDRVQLPQHYHILSSSSHSSGVVEQLLEANGLLSSVTFHKKSHTELSASDFDNRTIDAIIGEPYFSSSLLPWHNLHFWYASSSLLSLAAPQCVVLPGRGHLKAIAVKFENLYKLRAPVGSVEGFNITAFDHAVGKHVTTPEGIEAEPHPLWEYPSYAHSRVHTLMTFDFATTVPNKAHLEESGEVPLDGDGSSCHAMVFWMDFELTDGNIATTGLKQEPGSKLEKLEWSTHFKQGVYFLSPKDVSRSLGKLNYSIRLSTASGHMDMTVYGV